MLDSEVGPGACSYPPVQSCSVKVLHGLLLVYCESRPVNRPRVVCPRNETMTECESDRLSNPSSLRPSFYYYIVELPSLVIPGKEPGGENLIPSTR